MQKIPLGGKIAKVIKWRNIRSGFPFCGWSSMVFVDRKRSGRQGERFHLGTSVLLKLKWFQEVIYSLLTPFTLHWLFSFQEDKWDERMKPSTWPHETTLQRTLQESLVETTDFWRSTLIAIHLLSFFMSYTESCLFKWRIFLFALSI